MWSWFLVLKSRTTLNFILTGQTHFFIYFIFTTDIFAKILSLSITPEPPSSMMTLCHSIFTPWVIFRMDVAAINNNIKYPHAPPPHLQLSTNQKFVSLVFLIMHSLQMVSSSSNISDQLSSLELHVSYTESEFEVSDNRTTDTWVIIWNWQNWKSKNIA